MTCQILWENGIDVIRMIFDKIERDLVCNLSTRRYAIQLTLYELVLSDC